MVVDKVADKVANGVATAGRRQPERLSSTLVSAVASCRPWTCSTYMIVAVGETVILLHPPLPSVGVKRDGDLMGCRGFLQALDMQHRAPELGACEGRARRDLRPQMIG